MEFNGNFKPHSKDKLTSKIRGVKYEGSKTVVGIEKLQNKSTDYTSYKSVENQGMLQTQDGNQAMNQST